MPWILLLSLSSLWAGSFFFTEFALRAYSPIFIVFCRVSIAFVCLALYARFTGLSMPREGAFWRTIIPLGILNNVIPFCAIVVGQASISSGTASILNATTPMFTLLIAHLIARTERIGWLSGGGIVFGLIGVFVMMGATGSTGLGDEDQFFGQFLILISSLSYGFAFLFSRSLSPYPVVTTAAGMLFVSSLFMGLVVFTLGLLGLPLVYTHLFDPVPFAALLAFGTFCTALAYLFYFQLVKTEGATFTSLCTLLIPMLAVILGILFLNEPFGWPSFFGMGLILAGLALIQISRYQRRNTA